jgi:ribosomal protein S18 acetylase RimI-like enzyme
MVALADIDLRLMPLSEADPAELEPLFDEQCKLWLERLDWDYSGPSRMLREVVREREVSGLVAMAGEHPVGFAFYVVEGGRCSIGDIYASGSRQQAGADRRMATAIIQTADRNARLSRIEYQSVSFGNDGADQVFRERGFNRFERHFMMIDLSKPGADRSQQQTGLARAPEAVASGASAHPGNLATESDIRVRPWNEHDFAAAARIIHRSYGDEHDSKINSQYGTEQGCAELLSVLTDSIWCGEFMPRASRVAVSQRSGKQVGILVSSRIAAGAGHIGQISILPAYQNTGLGRRLVNSAMSGFADLKLSRVSLAVTSTNTRALHLYESLGFRVIHTFPVYYWER